MPGRVVITGMGTLNALGKSVAESWENVINGRTGVAPITLFDSSGWNVQVACEVKNFVPDEFMSPKDARRRDRYEQLASAAAKEAIHQAGLDDSAIDHRNVGVTISSSIGGLWTCQNTVTTLIQEGPRRISPFAIPMWMSNGASGMIAIDYGFTGPCFSIASACASGVDGIGVAKIMVQSGVVNVIISGGVDATISPIGVSAFDRLGAMSHQNSNSIPKPFDKNRDGLVMGEGAAVLVLEREEHARARGAEILAELAGYAATADAYHITAPLEDGAGSAQAMLLAIQAAGVNPDEVDYISAHGTATPLNDLSETHGIKTAFGKIAYNIPISSTKSMTGHMMGATGALETIFCIQAIRQSIIPPTINYETPDPECDLDYVPNEARSRRVRVAMNNAFGFGGHNSVLVIRAYS
jgi:beta-ketoacyl-acyl-carrier-protein synthase II